MANDYGKYQLSLKQGEVMINVSAVDREEFFQRVKDAKDLLAKEFPLASKPDVTTEKHGELPTFDKKTMPVPRCNFCNGDVWDNRVNKKNPKGPDFKCKECGGACWVQKDGAVSWKAGLK